MAWTTSRPPPRPSHDPANEHELSDDQDLDSDQIETAAEFLAALHEFTTLYDAEDAEDAEDADPHWSDSFDTYADFMAAANDPNLGNSDDSDTEE